MVVAALAVVALKASGWVVVVAVVVVEVLEREIQELELAMTDSKLHHEELNKLFSRKEELSEEFDGVMEEWLSLNC